MSRELNHLTKKLEDIYYLIKSDMDFHEACQKLKDDIKVYCYCGKTFEMLKENKSISRGGPNCYPF